MLRPLTTNKFLNDDELEHLKRHVDVENPNRDQLLIKFALMTGARASEILRLNRGSFKFANSMVYIVSNKGSRDREFELPRKFFDQLMGLMQDRDKPFPITYSRLHQIWKFYAPNNKKFHSLRHTFAVLGYLNTKDIRAVQAGLGHKDLKNTGIYLDFVYTQEYMRKMLVKF